MGDQVGFVEFEQLERRHREELTELHDRHIRERAALLARRHGSLEPEDDTLTRPDLGLKDLIPAAEGAELAKRAKPTMNTWCRENAIDGLRGFAIKIAGRWFVSKSRLLRHLASRSRD